MNTALISNHPRSNSMVAKEVFWRIFHFVDRFSQRLLLPLIEISLVYLKIVKFGPGFSCHISAMNRFQIFKIRLFRSILRWDGVRHIEGRFGAGFSLRIPILFHHSLLSTISSGRRRGIVGEWKFKDSKIQTRKFLPVISTKCEFKGSTLPFWVWSLNPPLTGNGIYRSLV